MKNYNNYIIILLLLVVSGIYAQRQGRERIKTLKVAFITERLALTSEEAQNFWPVYNQHEESIQRLRRKDRQRFGNQLPILADLSENEADKMLSDYQELQKDKYSLEQKYIQDLEKVLPSKKIVLLLKAEEDFKKRLLQQVRKRRGQ